MWHVYILLCKDRSLYTGSTNNLEKRLKSHISGKGSSYTRSHKPLKIIHSEKYSTKSEALKREHQIKSWTRSKKIADLNLKLQLPDSE